MRIVLTNQFHNCSTELNVPSLPHRLSAGQLRKVRRQNCGSRDCRCGALWEDPANGRIHHVTATRERLAVNYDYDGEREVLVVSRRTNADEPGYMAE